MKLKRVICVHGIQMDTTTSRSSHRLVMACRQLFRTTFLLMSNMNWEANLQIEISHAQWMDIPNFCSDINKTGRPFIEVYLDIKFCGLHEGHPGSMLYFPG